MVRIRKRIHSWRNKRRYKKILSKEAWKIIEFLETCERNERVPLRRVQTETKITDWNEFVDVLTEVLSEGLVYEPKPDILVLIGF